MARTPALSTWQSVAWLNLHVLAKQRYLQQRLGRGRDQGTLAARCKAIATLLADRVV
jgi:hypothetical protein